MRVASHTLVTVGLAAMLCLAALPALVEGATSVTLQPSAGDSFISGLSGETATNWGTSTTLNVKTSSIRRLLVRFDLSSIPADAAIKTASLDLYMTIAPGNNRTYGAFRITTNWTEGTVIWNAGTPWTTAGGDFTGTAVTTTTGTTSNVWKSWNIQAIVQAWVNGTNPNYGVLIKDQSEGGGCCQTSTWASEENATVANRPKLTVSYLLKMRDLTATAGNGQVILRMVHPGVGPTTDYNGTLIIRRTGTAPTSTPTDGTNYTAGSSTLADGSLVVFNDTASCATTCLTEFWNTGITNGTTYYYQAFTRDSSNRYSLASATVTATPTNTVSPNPTWGYSTSATSLAAPGIDPNDVVITGSNDTKLHGMNASDGTRAFVPFATGGAIQARPTVIPEDYTSSYNNLTPSLGYWKLDEGSGTVAADSSGSGNTGTLVNGPTWTTGKKGQALSFNGTNQYVNVPHTAALNAYPITVAAWFKTAGTIGGIVNKYFSSSNNGWDISLYNGNLCAWYYRNGSNYVFFDPGWNCAFAISGYNDNAWHHVAFVVDASGGKLYVDGIQRGSTIAWTGTAGATTTTQNVSIGQYAGAGSYFNGLVDDVRIYNRALSAAEVADLYGGLHIAYVTSQDGFVYAVNTSTGAQVWKSPSLAGANLLQAGASVWLQSLQAQTICGVSTDVVFVGTFIGSSDLNKVYALNGGNTTVTSTGGGNCVTNGTNVVPGGILWTYTGSAGANAMRVIYSTPYVDYSNAALWVTSHATGTTTPSVWKFNVANGTLAAGTSTWNLDDITASPVPSTDGSFMYVGTLAGTLSAIRISDGAVFTHTPASTAPCNCTGAGTVKGLPWPLGGSPEEIVFTRDNTIHKVSFNTATATFSVNWTIQLTGTPNVSAPVDDGAGNIYVGTSLGKVHRIRVTDGADMAQVTVIASPTPTVGDPTFDTVMNRIYVGGTDGHIYSFSAPF